MRTCTLNEEMAKNLTKSQTLGLLLGILRHQQAEKKMKLCCSIASPQRLSAFTSLAFICVYVIVAMLHPKRLSIYLKYRYIIQSRRSCSSSSLYAIDVLLIVHQLLGSLLIKAATPKKRAVKDVPIQHNHHVAFAKVWTPFPTTVFFDVSSPSHNPEAER